MPQYLNEITRRKLQDLFEVWKRQYDLVRIRSNDREVVNIHVDVLGVLTCTRYGLYFIDYRRRRYSLVKVKGALSRAPWRGCEHGDHSLAGAVQLIIVVALCALKVSKE